MPSRSLGVWASPGDVQLGGEGTPEIDEFAADELAPVLQVAPTTAAGMLGVALDLRHRLPWVYSGLRSGSLTWQAARAIAAGTRRLSLEQLEAASVGRRLFFSALRLTPGKLRTRIQEVAAQAAPTSVDDAAEGAAARQHVGFWPQPDHQVTSIFGELDPAGAQRLGQQVSAVAKQLRRLDHEGPWEALRARALTLLADPAGLRQLRRKIDGLGHHDGDPIGEGAANGPDNDRTDDENNSRLPLTVVHVHADRSVWERGRGPVELEGFGWVPLSTLEAVVSHGRLKVVESTTDLAHDRHRADSAGHCRPASSLADEVCGRDRTCRFPGCNRHARACQLDHSRPWPHGPTCACNLGPLCTRHHRLKTHTRWRLRQPFPGVFLWHSPSGDYWLTDHSGTVRLDDEARAA
ncbi:MAG: DUF222 domain-containing protein [Nocardioidaceae bacterium]